MARATATIRKRAGSTGPAFRTVFAVSTLETLVVFTVFIIIPGWGYVKALMV
jgi:hypothetical protein